MNRRKKPDPLPADPREALRLVTYEAEQLAAQAEEARRHADNALDQARDAAERAETLYHALDAWGVDHDRDRDRPDDAAAAAPTAIGAFERVAGDAPRFMHQPGLRLAIVERIGTASFAPWGFTIWEEGVVVRGQAAASWTADEACRRAKEWMAKNPEDPR
jgi:hypothetical protein